MTAFCSFLRILLPKRRIFSLKIESVTGDWHKRPTRNHFECYTHFISWSEGRKVLWIWREAKWELYTKNTPGRNSQGSKSNIKRLQTLNSVVASSPLLWQQAGIFNEGPFFSCPEERPCFCPSDIIIFLLIFSIIFFSAQIVRTGSGMKKSI